MKITSDSHIDHALTPEQVAFIRERFGDREGFSLETIELPRHLGTLTTALYGPSVGDPPVPEESVVYVRRQDRNGKSRMIDAPSRPTRLLTVIIGPENGETILYTAFGGPSAPREPFDPDLRKALEAAAEEVVTAADKAGPLARSLCAEEGSTDLDVTSRAAVDRLDHALDQIRKSRTFWSEHALSDR